MAQQSRLMFLPNRAAFLGMRLIRTVVTTIVFIITVVIVASLSSSWAVWAIVPAVLVVVYNLLDAWVAYKKQHYEFGADTAYYGTGNLFTDRNTELSFGNITHVRVKKPFIEYHLFGTGTIIVESAGSKGATVEMRAIDQPYEAFESIRDLLAKETFSLTYRNLLSEKKPSPLAVILGLIGGVTIAGGFIIFNIGIGTIVSILTDAPGWLFIVLAITIMLVGLTVLYVVYQDQLRRTYYVYSDVIHYSKGYLTRQEAFIPAGNLANTRLTQNFIGKLLNLQDVIVSCQGQGSEINFANLQDGEEMQQAINQLINHREALKSDKSSQSATRATAADRLVSNFTAPPTPRGEDVTAQDFSMDAKRALIPLAPLIIFPPALVVMLIAQYIAVKRTTYRLTDGGVASYYSFLSTRNVEFSRDKITGLVIKRNPFDRYFGTCTVTFWSIGSGAAVDFQHIPYSDELEGLMRSKAGIIDDETLEIIKPDFSLGNFCKSDPVSAVSYLVVVAVSIVLTVTISRWFVLLAIGLVVVLSVAFAIAYRRYAKAYLRLGRHAIALSIGVLFHHKYFARHDNVKDITLVKYPFSDLGKIQFNVAGERLVSASSEGNKTTIPNQFNIAYVPDIAADVRGERAWLDRVLLQKPDSKAYARLRSATVKRPETVVWSQPSLKNALALLIPIHVVIVPLIIILPISILICRYYLRRVSYHLERDRVVRRWGVIYRKQHSVLHERLDYTETGQGFLNKVFKNGNLYFYIAGSSKVELTLNNMSDYREFYQALKTSLGK